MAAHAVGNGEPERTASPCLGPLVRLILEAVGQVKGNGAVGRGQAVVAVFPEGRMAGPIGAGQLILIHAA